MEKAQSDFKKMFDEKTLIELELQEKVEQLDKAKNEIAEISDKSGQLQSDITSLKRNCVDNFRGWVYTF